EVAVGVPGVRPRCRTGSAPQDHLVAHELAVVLTQRSARRCVAGIADIGTRRPLPYVSVQSEDWAAVIRRHACRWVKVPSFQEMPGEGHGSGCRLPPRLAGQPSAGPAREGVAFVEGDMADRLGRVEAPQPPQAHHEPLITLPLPVEGGGPTVELPG